MPLNCNFKEDDGALILEKYRYSFLHAEASCKFFNEFLELGIPVRLLD